ncbi:MAG: DUF6514 family protein [Lachnospiraceae bacterium]|nr:DUF6514 family protein [Lachnospiraceae bacterium]
MGAKQYYGSTCFDEKELQEANISHNIELEYYGLQNEKDVGNNEVIYGIEVVKKEYIGEGVNEETSQIKHLTSSKEEVESIIGKLKSFKVTPIGLEDVVRDMFREKITE